MTFTGDDALGQHRTLLHSSCLYGTRCPRPRMEGGQTAFPIRTLSHKFLLLREGVSRHTGSYKCWLRMAFRAAAALGRSALRGPRTTHAPQHDDRSSTHAESAKGEYRRLVDKCQWISFGHRLCKAVRSGIGGYVGK